MKKLISSLKAAAFALPLAAASVLAPADAYAAPSGGADAERVIIIICDSDECVIIVID